MKYEYFLIYRVADDGDPLYKNYHLYAHTTSKDYAKLFMKYRKKKLYKMEHKFVSDHVRNELENTYYRDALIKREYHTKNAYGKSVGFDLVVTKNEDTTIGLITNHAYYNNLVSPIYHRINPTIPREFFKHPKCLDKLCYWGIRVPGSEEQLPPIRIDDMFGIMQTIGGDLRN